MTVIPIISNPCTAAPLSVWGISFMVTAVIMTYLTRVLKIFDGWREITLVLVPLFLVGFIIFMISK